MAAAAPGLSLGIFLMLIAPPVVSSPAFAGLIGLDAVHSLAVLVLAMTITPLTASLFVALFFDAAISLDPLAIGMRLLGLMGGAAIVAAIVRRAMGWQRIAAGREWLDGLNVVILILFIVALMGDTAYRLFAEPLRVGLIIALTFLVAGVILALSLAVLAAFGRISALTAALAACNRNMGIMPAAAGAALPPDAWLWFALAQFPIYLLPVIVKPFAARLASPATNDPSC